MKTSLPVIAASMVLLGFHSIAINYDPNPPATPDPKAGTLLKWADYDGDSTKPEEMTFQICVFHQPSEFLKLGGTISGTDFKLIKFVSQKVKNPSSGRIEDLSELTIQVGTTKQEVVLRLNEPITIRNAKPQVPEAKAGTRLKFQAYDGPYDTGPKKAFFQINTLDIRQPSEFLKIGDTINKTDYKISKFVFKEQKNPKTGESDDVSELTIVNTKTHAEVVLVLDKVVLVP